MLLCWANFPPTNKSKMTTLKLNWDRALEYYYVYIFAHDRSRLNAFSFMS